MARPVPSEEDGWTVVSSIPKAKAEHENSRNVRKAFMVSQNQLEKSPFPRKAQMRNQSLFLQVSQLFPLLSKRGMAWMVACRYFTAHALKQRWSVSCYRQGSETLKHGRFHRWAVLPLTHRVGENGPAWKKSWKHIIAISLVTVSAVSSLTNATQVYNKPYPPGNAYRKTYNSLGRCHGKNNLGFVNEGRGTI